MYVNETYYNYSVVSGFLCSILYLWDQSILSRIARTFSFLLVWSIPSCAYSVTHSLYVDGHVSCYHFGLSWIMMPWTQLSWPYRVRTNAFLLGIRVNLLDEQVWECWASVHTAKTFPNLCYFTFLALQRSSYCPTSSPTLILSFFLKAILVPTCHISLRILYFLDE